MHKDFYASGFLYHIPSQQILLQQYPLGVNKVLTWSLFTGKIHSRESFRIAFQRIIYMTLRRKLPEKTIYDVYDYYDADLKKNNAVVYAELSKLEHFPPKKNIMFMWLSTKNIHKLPIPEQMKHDITVGQRVINAKQRTLTGEQLPQRDILVNKT